MILIIGGAFQGKYDFTANKLKISNERIFSSFHLKVRKCIENNEDIEKVFTTLFNGEFDAVICDEIGCGIIPIEKIERIWREQTGRLLCRIAEKSEQVWRVQAGIGIRIK